MIIDKPNLVVISTKPIYELNSLYIRYADVAPDCSFENLTINIDAIGVSIYNLLTTKLGERLNLPDYGVQIDDVLFDLMDREAEIRILDELYIALQSWEPRVQLDRGRSTVKADPDNHLYQMDLYFLLVGLDNLLIKYSGNIKRFKNLMSNIVKG